MKRALAVVVLVLALPASAHASARTVNEPDTTKPAAQPDLSGTVGNTWWFEITLPDHPTPGSPGNCGTTYGYSGTTQSCPRYLYCLKYRDTNTNTYTNGNCWFAPGTLQTVAVNPNAKWYARLALGNLTSGHTYEACVDFEYYDYNPPAGWEPLQTYMCESTKIDTGAPTTSLTIDSGDPWTNNPNLSLRITYSDAVSAAWPASFMCADDTGCTSLGSFTYDSICSNYPASGQSCTRNFDGSDGLQRQCVSVADTAVPDNPSTSSGENGFTFHDQFAQATANFANLSSIACDTINLDRAGPEITMGGDPAVGTALQTTTFTASSTDSGIGATNGFLWDFGDGDTRTGKTIGHTYVSPGTYTVKVTNTDQLGNSTTKQISYTVNAAASTGGGGDPPGGGDPGGPTPGATDPAGSTPVGSTPVGSTPGGSDPGGSTPGGSNPGGPVDTITVGLAAPTSLSVSASRKGVVKLTKTTVTCPKSNVPCRVGGKLVVGKKTLGTLSLTVAGNSSAAVTQLKLSKAGLKALKKARKLKGTLTLTATLGSAKATKTVKLTLKAPK